MDAAILRALEHIRCPFFDFFFSVFTALGEEMIIAAVIALIYVSFSKRLGEQALVTVLSASCMLSAITFEVEMMAQEETEVLVIPVQVLSQLMQENLYVENFVYKTAAERFSDAISAVERMLFLTLEQRVVVYLLQESRRRGEETLRLTQEQMAQAIGSAREAVTRSLKKLADAGLVELFRGGVRILNREGLEERS